MPLCDKKFSYKVEPWNSKHLHLNQFSIAYGRKRMWKYALKRIVRGLGRLFRRQKQVATLRRTKHILVAIDGTSALLQTNSDNNDCARRVKCPRKIPIGFDFQILELDVSPLAPLITV